MSKSDPEANSLVRRKLPNQGGGQDLCLLRPGTPAVPSDQVYWPQERTLLSCTPQWPGKPLTTRRKLEGLKPLGSPPIQLKTHKCLHPSSSRPYNRAKPSSLDGKQKCSVIKWAVRPRMYTRIGASWEEDSNQPLQKAWGYTAFLPEPYGALPRKKASLLSTKTFLQNLTWQEQHERILGVMELFCILTVGTQITRVHFQICMPKENRSRFYCMTIF